MKVLIVDDSGTMRKIIQRTLRKAGFEHLVFEEAENGKDGLAQIDKGKPDLVLSDWNMPTMNGIEFLQAVRQQNLPVRFGFLTSEGTQDMRQLAQTHGALFFITKPFTPEVFSEVLGPLLKKTA